MKTNTRFGLHSTRNKIFRFCMSISSAYILMLSFFTLFPYYEDIERAKAEGAPNAVQSTINLDVTSNTAELNFSWTGGASGTFASSGDAIVFDASTNNNSGYTLRYVGSNDTGTLEHADGEFAFSSITAPLTTSDFSATANNAYNNKWGFKPSKYVSGDSVINNTGADGVFLPVPTTAGVIIDKTNAPNTNEENYTIEIGARADMNIMAGEYAGNYNILITANPVSYRITYAAGNTTDEVQNLPETQNSSTSDTSITLSSETPTRAHYSFLGWCDVLPTTTNGIDSCTGTNEVTGSSATQYAVGSDFGINQTTQNNTTLYAMWQIDTFTCTKQYRLENADGSWSDYIADGEEAINSGDSCAYTKTVTDYKDSASGTNGAQASTTATDVTSDQTLSLDFYRNTYQLGAVNGSNITRVTGGGTYRWGQTVTVTATPKSDTACVTYSTPTWSVGGNGTASSTSGTSIDYTMDKGMAILTAISRDSRVAQTVTLSRSTGVSSINIDGADYSGSSVSLYCGTHSISGNYDSGYEFSSWTVASNVSVTSTSSAKPTLVVSGGGGTLTLNARRLPSIQSITASTCTTTAKQVYDTRDNSVYTIQKLADGRCWLLDNLRLDLTDSDVRDNLTSSTTNASDTTLGYLKGATTRDPSIDPNGQYATAGVVNWTSDVIYSYSAPQIDTASKDASVSYAMGQSGTGKVGAYYNYCAASAGSYCYGNGTGGGVSSGNATEDICPKGWRMGSSGEYQSLYTAYSSDGAAFANALRTPLSGYFYNGDNRNQGSYGYFWSSTRNVNNRMHNLYVSTSEVDPQDYRTRNMGYPVRCILDETSISEVTTMQQFGNLNSSAKTKVLNSMTVEQAYSLTDSRDGTVYNVGKLADGNVWLLDNLALDLTSATVQTNLTSSTTNASDNSLNHLKGTTTRDPSTDPNGQYATAGVANWTSSYSYSAPLIDTASKDTSVSYAMGQSGTGNVGVYYNYCAASAGSYCYGDGTSQGAPVTQIGNATEDICPKGWRMPTGDSSGEYQSLYTTYSSDGAAFVNALHTPLSGSFNNGSASNQGSNGNFWSSTRAGNSQMSVLDARKSGSVRPQGYGNRYFGFSVRCVLQQ